MIYTVTFNPSLDYVIRVKNLQPGEVNRTEREDIYPGGKGINVSIVLKNLGLESKALGFKAGFTGEEIEKRLKDHGCAADFIQIPGLSRINVKVRADRETELNGQGPEIPDRALEGLFEKLKECTAGDVVVLAGSIPESLPADIYERILGMLEGRGVISAVDATGDLLRNVLKYRPFLIKPNNKELGGIFGKELKTVEELATHARILQQEGARNVLVSMAGNGALLAGDDGMVYRSPAPEGTLVNSVGSGDSMVAGFVAGTLTGKGLADAFRLGLAAGSASAFQEWLAPGRDIMKLLKTVGAPKAL